MNKKNMFMAKVNLTFVLVFIITVLKKIKRKKYHYAPILKNLIGKVIK